MDILVVYILVNALLAAPVAYVASQKGRSPLGFFALSFFFSFVVGILVVLAMPPQPIKSSVESFTGKVAKTADGDELAKCPFCAEWIKSEAIRCRYCGEDVEGALAEIRATESKAKEDAARAAEVEKVAAAQHAEETKGKRKKAILFSFVGAGLGGALLVGTSIFISTEQKNAEVAKALEIAETECPGFRDNARNLEIFLEGAYLTAMMGRWSEAETNLSKVDDLRDQVTENSGRLPGVLDGTDPFVVVVDDFETSVGRYIDTRDRGEDPLISRIMERLWDSRSNVLQACVDPESSPTPAP
jgi:hypothetical protein